MFTGIIQSVGEIRGVSELGQGLRLTIAVREFDLSDVAVGDSIAVNGVCLTAVALHKDSFEVDVSQETLSCTTGLNQSGGVNLEKALRLSDRLGGHLVTGHVDGLGRVLRFERIGESYLLSVQFPVELAKYIARKGSITINGVSLTVNDVNKGAFSVNLIPHTIEVTTLKDLQSGGPVNLEIDLVARYVERMVAGT